MPGERQVQMCIGDLGGDQSISDEELLKRFYCWYYRVMKNEFRNELKKLIIHKRRFNEVNLEELGKVMSFIQPMDIEEETVLVGSTPVIITDSKLATVIKRLSSRMTRVIEGTVILQLPIGIIAKEMNISEQTVKNYKRDGLRCLKRWLEDYHDA